MTKIKGLEEIYTLRSKSLDYIVNFLNPLYLKDINKKYITKIKQKNFIVYNMLTDVIRYIEAIY